MKPAPPTTNAFITDSPCCLVATRLQRAVAASKDRPQNLLEWHEDPLDALVARRVVELEPVEIPPHADRQVEQAAIGYRTHTDARERPAHSLPTGPISAQPEPHDRRRQQQHRDEVEFVAHRWR